MQKSDSSQEFLAEVALTLPLHQTFTYTIPRDFGKNLCVGQRVLVPFGPRRLTGHVIDLPQSRVSDRKLKSIIDVLDPEPIFSAKMLDFFKWVASYYQSPLGEVLRTATPSGIDLKSMRQVTLTPEGQAQVDPQRVDSAQDRVFKKLSDDGPTPMAQLLKLGGVTSRLIKSFEKRGWVTIDSALERVRVKIRTERVVSLNPDTAGDETAALKLRGAKQKQVLDLLKDYPLLTLSHLEQHIKGSRQSVERLVKLGLLKIQEREDYRDPFAAGDDGDAPAPLELTDDQQKVLVEIEASIERREPETFLLHGVTGSGKTEVYIRCVQKTIDSGRQAIVLVPEISLTPQMVRRFRSRFGKAIAVLHSGLSDGERYDEWRRILKGEVKLVVGARSAIFAPLSNVGLIVVDEEHEGAFKQETGLLYHARDLAIMRAQFSKAVVILGSATPSVETYYKAKEGKFRLLELPVRVGLRPMPEVEIVNMATAPLMYRLPGSSKQPIFSKALWDAISETLARKEQVVLLLNRRGYVSMVQCPGCGHVARCPQCAISLTAYQSNKTLRCHYCDHTEPLKRVCNSCGAEGLNSMGFGTESLEEEIAFHFPEARLARLDRDTTTKKGSHRTILKRIQDGEADILLGTQMVAKGHDFPQVTLVGVIQADTALHMPDFRAGERTFQLLTQVAGRAGRGDKPGRVIIQSHSPDHYSLVHSRTHNFAAFYEEEVELRRALRYPPFARIVCLRFTAEGEVAGERAIGKFKIKATALREQSAEYRDSLVALGPVPAPLARLRGQFRWQMLLKSERPQILHRFAAHLKALVEAMPEMKNVKLQIDVDPLNLL